MIILQQLHTFFFQIHFPRHGQHGHAGHEDHELRPTLSGRRSGVPLPRRLQEQGALRHHFRRRCGKPQRRLQHGRRGRRDQSSHLEGNPLSSGNGNRRTGRHDGRNP